MAIQWFPGHMAKAQRQIREELQMIDVVLELVDARIPYASSNPQLQALLEDRPKIVLLNKADLADEAITEQWMAYHADEEQQALKINAKTGEGLSAVSKIAASLVAEQRRKAEAKGVRPRNLRALIMGIPNVGKSTLINRMANKRTTEVGDRPGVTKGQSWIKTSYGIDLLDTPGILWPKFENEAIGYRLAATGAIKEDVFDIADVALFVLQFCKKHLPHVLSERYRLAEIPEDDIALFDLIGQKRGCLVKGGYVDYEKTAGIILRDLRSGKLERVSLETPEDIS